MPTLTECSDPNSMFYQMKAPNPVSLSNNPCEDTQLIQQPIETSQLNPPTETTYTLRGLLPEMSPTVLTNIEFQPEDQESEEWIGQLQSWSQRINQLENRIMTNPCDHGHRPPPSTEPCETSTPTINPTTSDRSLSKSNHQFDGPPQPLKAIAKAISLITTRILASLIHRSLIRLALFYPTTVNKQTVLPITINQLKLRPTQP